jgi:hypothetical protein
MPDDEAIVLVGDGDDPPTAMGRRLRSLGRSRKRGASVESSPQAQPRRPGVVSFIGVILYVQAFLAAVAAVSLLIWRGDILDFLEKEGSPMSSGVFSGTIVGEAVTAVLLFIVASGLMRGSHGMRLFVAIAQLLSMSLAVYVLIAHHVGGYVYRGVFSLFIGVFVLWALYGNDESDRFFEAQRDDRSRTSPTTIWGPADSLDQR